MQSKKSLLSSFLIFAAGVVIFFIVRKGIDHFTSKEDDFESQATETLVFNKDIGELRLISDTTVSLSEYLKGKTPMNRMLILLDGGCSMCAANLKEAKLLIEKHHIDQERLLFIGYGAGLPQLKFVTNSIYGPDCTMFMDPQYHFGNANKIDPNGNFKAMIVNKDWKILAKGDLLNHKENLEKLIPYLSK